MAASEALSLVALTPADIGGGLALSGAAGWNQTADDWVFFIAQGHGCGFRTASGALVATAAAVVYGGGIGWISMVLVAHDWRHRGLASLLMDGSIKRLQAAHITPVLDATPAGEPVYRHLGFRSGFGLERWQGIGAPGAAPAPAEAAGVRAAGVADLDAIAALDQLASGVGRRPLLQNLFGRDDVRAWMSRDGSGFVLARAGRRAMQLGPLVARDAAAAIALLAAALHAIVGPIFLDVPKRWAELIAWLERAAFVRQRPYVRMALGSAAPLACGDRMFVLAGPEFG
jgi:GNAT superfamily N-acetyltransferase